MTSPVQKDNLVLICGETGSGKSASLMNLPNQEGVLYLNTESGKKLPFRNKFIVKNLINPMQIFEAFQWAETQPHVHTIVIDSLTYLLEMYESQFVLTAADTRSAWSGYAQFFKQLMQVHVAASTKEVIFTAHTAADYDEAKMSYSSKVPVKGSLKNNGIESYFSCVVTTRRMPVVDLAPFANPLLIITPDDVRNEVKNVFQTRITKNTVNDRIRGPIGLFSYEETYIDNDAAALLRRLSQFYTAP